MFSFTFALVCMFILEAKAETKKKEISPISSLLIITLREISALDNQSR